MPSEIRFYRGDTHAVEVAVTSSSAPVDLTDASARLTVKSVPTDAVPLVRLDGAVTDGLGATMRFVFQPEDTEGLAAGTYAYDVQVDLANGERYTVSAGQLVMLQDVG